MSASRAPRPPPPWPRAALSHFHVLGLCLSGQLRASWLCRWLGAGLDSFGQVARAPSLPRAPGSDERWKDVPFL